MGSPVFCPGLFGIPGSRMGGGVWGGGVDPLTSIQVGERHQFFRPGQNFPSAQLGPLQGGGDTPPHTEVQVTDFWPGTKRQAERPHPQPTPNSKKQLLPYLRSEF